MRVIGADKPDRDVDAGVKHLALWRQRAGVKHHALWRQRTGSASVCDCASPYVAFPKGTECSCTTNHAGAPFCPCAKYIQRAHSLLSSNSVHCTKCCENPWRNGANDDLHGTNNVHPANNLHSPEPARDLDKQPIC